MRENEQWQRANTDWFRDTKWGVFVHYLASMASDPNPADLTPEEWNRRIDAFDVATLARQLEEIGARYLFMTLGQNSGFFLSPNSTYDSLVDRRPSRCSQRDLVSDLCDALAPRGIRMLVYVPSHAPTLDRQAVERLGCTPTWNAGNWHLTPNSYTVQGGTDERLSVFQRHWEAVIREWSLRWRGRVSGWWIDGCYYADRMYRDADEPNFRSFATALKAGNPDGIVAFNPGVVVPVISLTRYEDYTAGEVSAALPVGDGSGKPHRFVDGAQYHILSYLGTFWGRGAPRLPNELVVGFTKHINRHEGVVTWDVPVTVEGRIPEVFVGQLTALRHSL